MIQKISEKAETLGLVLTISESLAYQTEIAGKFLKHTSRFKNLKDTSV